MNDIKKRNKELGIVDIEDVDELYNKLFDWDKKDFIEKHIYDSGYQKEQDEEVYHFDDIWEFVRDHDDDDILSEIGDDSCFAYLRNQWTLQEFIDALKDSGYSWSHGYNDERIVHELDLTNMSKEEQLNILKQLDKNVIADYLKNNTQK